MKRQEMQMDGLVDGYAVFERNGEELLRVGELPEIVKVLSDTDFDTKVYGWCGRYKSRYISTINLRVIAFTSYLTIFKGQIHFLLLALVMVVALGISNAWGFSRVSNAVLKPLTLLSKEMRSYVPGKAVELQIETDDEISDLCSDFKRMAAKVDQQVDELRDKERSNAITQYRLLVTQIDPHFIYNTMALINALAFKGDNKGVLKINTALIRLLRERLNTRATIMASIRSEIETLNEYLNIMGYRYGETVRVGIDVDPQLLDSKIPKNLLQPLIENAFMHGLTDENGVCQGSIDVLIYESGENIVIEVSDDGKGISSDKLDQLNRGEGAPPDEKHTHIGFNNLRQRLRYIYERNFELTVYSVVNQGSTVTIVLPQEDNAALGNREAIGEK